MKRVASYGGVLLVILALVFFTVGPRLVEGAANRIAPRAPYRPSPEAVAIYERLRAVDLHTDSLLWGRDLSDRGSRGHVDIPRLIEGNVTLQAFTIVSKVPLGLNIERNEGKRDMITLLAIGQGWPVATWSSLKERALYQARKLHEYAADSRGKFTLIKNRDELASYLERRSREPRITAGFLGIEGAQVLEGDIRNVDVMFDAGFRMMAPTHFFDTEVGGSAHGVEKGGLTALGKEMIRRMESKRMILDLAHASPKLIDDALVVATRPILVSHTGVKGTCDNRRNLSDDHVRGIARTGGVIGIGYWDTAVCGTDGRSIAKAIRYVVNLVGVEHVGLGSDFDGAITAPFDTTGLVEIADALLADGLGESDIAKVMGGNALRVLAENLP